MTRMIAILSAVPIVLVCLGCAAGRVSFSYYDDDPPPTRVVHVHKEPVHVHRRSVHVCRRGDHDCYWDGAKVVVIPRHRHGPNCGHLWNGKHWVVVKKAKVRRAHRPPARVTRIRRLP